MSAPFRLYEPWVGKFRDGRVAVYFNTFSGDPDEHHGLIFADKEEARQWLTDALAKLEQLP